VSLLRQIECSRVAVQPVANANRRPRLGLFEKPRVAWNSQVGGCHLSAVDQFSSSLDHNTDISISNLKMLNINRTANPQDFGLLYERASQHAIILRFASKNVVFARKIRSEGNGITHNID
jgi:hypothetical protein